MKTVISQYPLLVKNLMLVLSLLFLVECTSEAEREFRKINGRIVVVDSTYHIPKGNLAPEVLEAGTYKIEFDEAHKKYIWFQSLLSESYMVLMDFAEYRNTVENKVFRDATPTDIANTEREKKAKSKILEAKSVDLHPLLLVVGKKYNGDAIMEAIDKSDPKASYHSDETINFKFGNKYYYVGTEKATFDYPAVYKITFIKYKSLPWEQGDY